MGRNKGFTLIETLIVLVVAGIIAIALFYVLNSSRRASRIASIDAQAQQNARVAVDYLTRDLRSVGYGVDVGNGQLSIVYASPYELIFNANIEPNPDNSSSPGYPTAIDIDASPATVPPSGAVHYAPTRTYTTGAETIRLTLDSNNDGVIDDGDNGDDAIEQTRNPYDYALIRQVYGYNGSSNGGESQQIALVRGPDPYDDGSYPMPLFTYWYDDDGDASTPDVLWGDVSGDGILQQSEIATLTPIPAGTLPLIKRIGINAIGSARATDPRVSRNEGYRETLISSEVTVRNTPLRSAYIVGLVFNDLNSDGVQGFAESGLSGVTVRLNTGAQRTTDAAGGYAFRVDPGTYTVTEVDPVGYTSTTPNAVVVTAVKGAATRVNFGDKAIGGYGLILGRVLLYEEVPGEDPIPTGDGVSDVEIYLNTGDRDTTSWDGSYMFLVPVSTYSITLVVPPSYAAVGPTTVDRTLSGEGDTVHVNFGLLPVRSTGTIAGKVFLDSDEDGILDPGESGIASVVLRLNTGDSTLTDADGLYSFTVAPGTYDVTEEDLGGYESTTINHVTGVVVQAESTVTVNFGDKLATDLSFTVITLGETQRALCITSADLHEDNKNEPEIILGTKYVSGVSNLNVWFNNWRNSSTPNSAIFEQEPTYSRTPAEDIYSIDAADVDGDGVNDVVTGLTSATGRVLVWLTQTHGSHKGKLPTSPSSFFVASTLADILAIKLSDVDDDGDPDALIGTEYLYPQGKLEVWFNDGSGNFSHTSDDIYDDIGGPVLNSVRDLGVGDVCNSPADDVILGTISGVNTGKIEIFRDRGSPNGKFAYHGEIDAAGEVNCLIVTDMLEDTDGDLDILVGTKTGEGTGMVELWLGNGDGTFGVLNGFGEYEPSDTLHLNGEVLCMGVDRFDSDVYPDLAVGIKQAGTYSGNLLVYQCYGYLPSSGNAWVSPNIGEAITLTINDFNKDYRPDIAVGTRTSLSQGHVVVFFND